jgi:hypothetical protein
MGSTLVEIGYDPDASVKDGDIWPRRFELLALYQTMDYSADDLRQYWDEHGWVGIKRANSLYRVVVVFSEQIGVTLRPGKAGKRRGL